MKNTDFVHQSVCHKYHFKDPITGVHTQNVESYNNKIKHQIKEVRGLDDDKREDFLKEFMWLDYHKDLSFDKIIKLLELKA